MALIPWSTIRALLVAVAVAAPLPYVWKKSSEKRLTWTTAIIVGSWLFAITIILVGDIPSRLLYWFDANHTALADKFHFLKWWEKNLGGNPGYQLVADIVANTVQGVFFVAIAVGAYFWGEKHRKAGRF